ncbi:MAG: hypothetical protein PHP88_08000 [bacterium]|nr:hypothetical protein [bacterium]
MTVRDRVVVEGIRFAAGVASAPSAVVNLWKAATGGKAVGCVPATPVPELLLAAGLLPIAVESTEDISLLSGQLDAWLVGTDPPPFHIPDAVAPRFVLPSTKPADVEEGLDRLEALAEWVCAVSCLPASEGRLWKSIRAHATRRSLLDALDDRCAGESAFLAPEERGDIVRAGVFLPPEAHCSLISNVLGVDPDPAVIPPEGEHGDPLLLLAKRLM